MKKIEPNTFLLDNFEGPLEFLIHLIQKHELKVTDVHISQIIQQFLEQSLAEGDDNLHWGRFLLS